MKWHIRVLHQVRTVLHRSVLAVLYSKPGIADPIALPLHRKLRIMRCSSGDCHKHVRCCLFLLSRDGKLTLDGEHDQMSLMHALHMAGVPYVPVPISL